MSQYAYLLLGLFSLVIWFFLYKNANKQAKKELIIAGVLSIVIGILFQIFFWRTDWWVPFNITNTIIGFEDIVYGFATGGILATTSQILFKKYITIQLHKKTNVKLFLLLGFLSILITTILFYLFHIHSFYATIVSYIIPSIIIFLLRKDIFLISLSNSFIWFFSSAILYFVVNLIQPGFIQDIWLLENLSGIYLFSVPIEDLVWYFSASLFITSLYQIYYSKKISYTFHFKNRV